MSRLLLFAAVAVVLATAGCSSKPHDRADAGGTTGTAGAAAPGGTGGAAIGGTGGDGIGGTTGTAGTGTATGNAGIGGTTSSAGIGGTTGSAGIGGTTGSAGAGGTTGTAGVTGSGGAGTQCLGNDIDVRATTVSGAVTINGVAATDPTTKGEGSIFLRNATDTALLGSTANASGTYSALVIPGTYDLYFGFSAAGTAVPNNARAKLRSGVVVGASPLHLDVDIPTTKVSGTVTVNGGAITNTNGGEGTVSLVNAAGDSAILANTAPTGSYSALVVPGTYDLYYTNTVSGSLLPTNTAAKIQSGIVVGTSPLSLNIDVPVQTVSAAITINGAAVTGAAKGQWFLALKNAAGDRAELLTYASSTGAYSARVVPGTYDLYWTCNGSDLPGNTAAKIKSGIVVGTSALSLSVDVPSATISGAVTVNGAVSSALFTGITYLNLRNAAGDTVPLPIATAGTYSARAIPGTYDLYYGNANAGLNSTVPRNAAARIQSAIVVGTSPLALNIDIPATTVSGTATINGTPITTTAQSAFVLTLQSAAGDKVQLATRPQGGAFSTPVVPGTYDLYYTRQGDIGLEVPNNVLTKIRSGIVVGASPFALDVDIRATTVSGAITTNGVVNPGVPGDLAFIALSDGVSNIADSGAQLTPAVSASGTYQTRLLAGRYELYYFTFRATGTTIPRNLNAHLGCFIVP